MRRRGVARVAGTATVIATLVLAALAGGAPSNGGFERGDLKGWKKKTTAGGDWVAYVGPSDNGEASMPPAPQGTYAAAGVQDEASAGFLYRKLKLRKNHKIKLSFYVFYDNAAEEGFRTPKHFKVSLDQRNQQYRIDLLRQGAPIQSLKKRDVLKTLFRTRRGDPDKLAPKKLSFNLTKFAGRTVTLRFAFATNLFYMTTGVDDVRLVQTKKKRR